METGGTIPVNVEGNEVVNGLQVQGPSHAGGGIDMNLLPGSQVFSDKIKGADGKTMAQRKIIREKKESRLQDLIKKDPANRNLKKTLTRVQQANQIEEHQDLSIMQEAYNKAQQKQKLETGTGFWGIKNGQYQQKYKDAVTRLTTDKNLADKAVKDLSGTGYVKNVQDILKYAYDKKVGPVHKYIYSLSEDTPPSTNTVNIENIPQYKYTHTTDANFYKTMSPEEQEKYDPKTLTRDITEEEYNKATKSSGTNKWEKAGIAGYNKIKLATGVPSLQDAIKFKIDPAATDEFYKNFNSLFPLNNSQSTIQNRSLKDDAAIVGKKVITDEGGTETMVNKDYQLPTSEVSSKENKENNSFDLGMTLGDIVGLGGDAISSLSGYFNTLRDRATDTPNINYYKGFGQDGLQKTQQMEQYVQQMLGDSYRDIAQNNAALASSERNSARGINTLRGLDIGRSMATDDAKRKALDSASQMMMNIYGQEAQQMDKRDAMVMQGEEKRDTADRMNKDNYLSQMGKDLQSLGYGIQKTGSDINTIKTRNVTNTILNQIFPNFKVDAVSGKISATMLSDLNINKTNYLKMPENLRMSAMHNVDSKVWQWGKDNKLYEAASGKEIDLNTGKIK